MRSPVNTANGHIWQSQTVESFTIQFTPIIRSLVLNLDWFKLTCDRSISSIIVIYLVAKQPIYFTTLLQRKQHFSLTVVVHGVLMQFICYYRPLVVALDATPLIRPFYIGPAVTALTESLALFMLNFEIIFSSLKVGFFLVGVSIDKL